MTVYSGGWGIELVFFAKKVLKILQYAGVGAILLVSPSKIAASDQNPPYATQNMVSAFDQTPWQELETGLSVIRGISQNGTVMNAFRISPNYFTFEFALAEEKYGARAREIGEREGAVLISNGGFFAQKETGELYPIGYLRKRNNVLAKGWHEAGGVISIMDNGIQLTPTNVGIPKGEYDAMQSRPMLIEPGGKWAMKANLSVLKLRTLLCKLPDGDIILATITRYGMSLYDAGWVMRDKQAGGFFGCDSALALDGGRSTQVWYSGDEGYSFAGLTPVHNFLVVRTKED